MKRIAAGAGIAALLLTGLAAATEYTGSGLALKSPASPPQGLRSPDSFTGYADPRALSRAYFAEAGRVILHPRCMNCHPATRSPTQGDEERAHNPHVIAGADDRGAPGLRCAACHQTDNTPVWGRTIRSVPGAPKWALAPAAMAWQGKSLGQICELIKDPGRNGGRSLAQIRSHMADDDLVGWGWRPGAGRTPAPGTQKSFGALIDAWIRTGASCPAEPLDAGLAGR